MNLKVIHLPFCFYPDPVGGTEVYVEALARELEKCGINTVIAAPGKTNQSYLYNQLKVRRFAISQQVNNLKEMYGEGDKVGAFEFSKILNEEQPDLIHLHAFTSGTSLRIVRLAKSRGIPVIFTYHTPTVSCQRGTLLQWGNQVCDGKIELNKCNSCTLEGLGISKNIAQQINNIPSIVGRTLSHLNISGGIWTALQMRELVNYRHHAFHSLMSEVDHIVAVCDWVRNILIINQICPEKVTLIRQGLCQEILENFEPVHKEDKSVQALRLVFLGRLDPTKGVDILINAFLSKPQLNATLDIYGISQSTSTDSYQQQLHNIAKQDKRISFKPPVCAAQVIQTLKEYDLLAVPSQCLETGPMVILEAFAAGIPVIGSNLGGIAELVQHNVNGLLVEASSIKAWADELQNLCDNKDKLEKLKLGIHPPQLMTVVAKEMNIIYKRILTLVDK